MTRRRYTAAERQQALDAYVLHGLAEAARRAGVPKTTVSTWAARAGVRTDDATASRARARTEAARARWLEVTEERRQELAGRLLVEAHALADQLQAPTLVRQVVTLAGGKGEPARAAIVDVELATPPARDQRDRALALAAVVDRVQLLSGGATERAEQLAGLDLEEEAALFQLGVEAGRERLAADAASADDAER